MKDSLPRIESLLSPELQTLNRFHFPVSIRMKISLRGANMGMPHQSLNGSKVIPIVQEGGRKGVPHYMRMDSLLG